MERGLHHLEAEQAVLGALLDDNALLERVAPLAAEHFYDPVHARIFAEIHTRIGSGRLADALSLKSWAAADPGVSALGGNGTYLLRLLNASAALPAQIIAYAEVIRDLASRRAAKRALQDMLSRIESGEVLLEVLAESEAALRDLGDTGDDLGDDVATAGEQFILGMDTPSLATGINALDARIGGLHRGELLILAGRPSMGKTALAAQVARNVAERGRAVHFASLEMPKEQLACRAISAFSMRREYGTERVEYYHLRNGSNVDRRLLGDLAAELPRSLIIDDRAAQTLAQLEQGARSTRKRLKRLDLIVVDYLQLMRALRRDGRVNEVAEISQGLKAIAKRLQCPVLALSQLSRGVESRDDKRPTLSDLRDSGAIEQDADVVLACYREAYYLERSEPEDSAPAEEWKVWKSSLERCKRDMEVLILKQRAGPTATIKLDAWLEFDVVRDRRAA